MALIDRYVPIPHYREYHSASVRAPADTVIAAAAAYRTESDAFFRGMIALRELPMRAERLLGRRPIEPQPPFGIDDFTLLQRCENEVVFGLAGRFWRSDFDLAPPVRRAGLPGPERAGDREACAQLCRPRRRFRRDDAVDGDARPLCGSCRAPEICALLVSDPTGERSDPPADFGHHPPNLRGRGRAGGVASIPFPAPSKACWASRGRWKRRVTWPG